MEDRKSRKETASPERDARMRQSYAELGSYDAVAERFGVCLRTVDGAMARTGGRPSEGWRNAEYLREAYGRLGTWRAVALEVGAPNMVVCNAARRLGAFSIVKGFRNPVLRDASALQAAHGRLGSWSAVAAELGVDHVTMWRARQIHGGPLLEKDARQTVRSPGARRNTRPPRPGGGFFVKKASSGT